MYEGQPGGLGEGGTNGVGHQALGEGEDGVDESIRPITILSNGILRSGRRTKREAVELAAALEPYSYQYVRRSLRAGGSNTRRPPLGPLEPPGGPTSRCDV